MSLRSSILQLWLLQHPLVVQLLPLLRSRSPNNSLKSKRELLQQKAVLAKRTRRHRMRKIFVESPLVRKRTLAIGTHK